MDDPELLGPGPPDGLGCGRRCVSVLSILAPSVPSSFSYPFFAFGAGALQDSPSTRDRRLGSHWEKELPACLNTRGHQPAALSEGSDLKEVLASKLLRELGVLT